MTEIDSDKKKKTEKELLQENETLRRRLEKAERVTVISGEPLTRLESLYRVIIENMLEAALIILSNGTIIYCNRHFADMLKKPMFKLIGSKIFGLISPSNLPGFRDAFERGRWTGSKCEVQLRIEGDNEIPVVFSFGTVRGTNGSTLVATIMDLSDQKEREILQERLHRAEKLEAIGTLSAGIAHDLHNALTPIRIYTDMALLDLPQENPTRDFLKGINEAAIRARKLVEQIRTFAAHKDGEKKIIQMGPIVKECMAFLQATIPATIELHSEIRDDSGTIYADPTQIHRIVINLCINAAYSMKKKGGKLKVCLWKREMDETEKHPNSKSPPGSYMCLSVTDTGTGMTPEVMRRMYDPFFTTKKPGEGSGMGLAVVHGIVKSLKGTIEVQSEVGKGTTFEIFLPMIQGEQNKESAPSGPIPAGHERILFVDDDEILVRALHAALTRLGYKMTLSTNGSEALKIFKSQPHEFDLVMTDQVMPGLTGMELAEKILRIRRDIPIILCTGYSDMISSEKATAMGFRGFIMKPFTVREAAELVRGVLDQKELSNTG